MRWHSDDDTWTNEAMTAARALLQELFFQNVVFHWSQPLLAVTTFCIIKKKICAVTQGRWHLDKRGHDCYESSFSKLVFHCRKPLLAVTKIVLFNKKCGDAGEMAHGQTRPWLQRELLFNNVVFYCSNYLLAVKNGSTRTKVRWNGTWSNKAMIAMRALLQYCSTFLYLIFTSSK